MWVLRKSIPRVSVLRNLSRNWKPSYEWTSEVPVTSAAFCWSRMSLRPAHIQREGNGLHLMMCEGSDSSHLGDYVLWNSTGKLQSELMSFVMEHFCILPLNKVFALISETSKFICNLFCPEHPIESKYSLSVAGDPGLHPPPNLLQLLWVYKEMLGM